MIYTVTVHGSSAFKFHVALVSLTLTETLQSPMDSLFPLRVEYIHL